MTEPIPINDLTFGIELECIMPRDNRNEAGRNALAAFLVAGGVECRHEVYNHNRRTWWKIVTDSSLGYDNAEVVSPILKDAIGYMEVAKVCALMTEFGCRVSRQCGTHVHVGVRDRFAEQIGFFKELLKTHAKFQPIIDQLVAPSRRGRVDYVVPVRYTPEMDRATTLDQLGRLANAGHFSNPNFWDAFTRHGTVEFRQHQGSLNGEKLVNWVKLCQRMVSHAAKNTELTRVGSGEFRPPPRPILPAEPWFSDPVDLSSAPHVPDGELTAARRGYYSSNWVIGRIGANPRRSGRGFRNWYNYVLGMTVRDYLRAGHPWDQLRWDVVHYHAIDIVDTRMARTVPVIPGSDEDHRRTALIRAHRETVERLIGEHERLTTAARTAWEAVNGGGTPTVSRPATDAAPATLDGLLELIGSPEPERAFFVERQMELNQ